MVTTISDYSKFIESLMQHKGLNHDSYEEMFSPQIAIHSKSQFPPISYDTNSENDAIHLSYGLGWGLLKCQYGLAFLKRVMVVHGEIIILILLRRVYPLLL